MRRVIKTYKPFHSFYSCLMKLHLNKISPNNGILFNGVLRLKLLNISIASCSIINLDILVLHIAQFDNGIVLPLLVFETFEFISL